MTTGQTVAVPRKVILALAFESLQRVKEGGPDASGAAQALRFCLQWLGYSLEPETDQPNEPRQAAEERF